MFSKLKNWWRGRGQSTPPVRIPADGMPTAGNDNPQPIIAPTRFSNSAAQEHFAAAVLNTQDADRKQERATTIKREAAFHEAGHAIAACRSAFHWLAAGAIRLEEYGAGEAQVSLSKSKLRQAGKVPSAVAMRDPEVAKDLAVILVAGLVAEQVAQSMGQDVTANSSCAAPDHALIKQSLENAGVELNIQAYENTARHMLQSEWPLLLSLADLLFDRRVVENYEVLEFIQSFQVGPQLSFEIESENNGDFDYGIFNKEWDRVGRIAVATIPDDHRLYVMQFHVDQEYRGKGYGLAAVTFVAQQHGQVIVPVNDHSHGFWKHLRNRSDLAFTVEDEISLTSFHELVNSNVDHDRPN
jgi:GNAT superfamily N-acetyltransferase